MGLRLVEGVDPARFSRITGLPLDDLVDADARARLTAGGLIERDMTTLRATAAGRQRLNAVLAALLIT